MKPFKGYETLPILKRKSDLAKREEVLREDNKASNEKKMPFLEIFQI